MFEESDIDEGFACAEAAIARGVPGGDEAKADLLNIRAHRTLAAGDPDAALAAWAALIASYPTYLQAYVQRANVLEKRGDHAAALAELDRFIERSPTEASGYIHRARLYQAAGDGERALANFRRAMQLDRTSSEAHLGMATALAAKGDARGATRAFAQAAEEVLGDAESYNLRAFMHFVAGQEELALADYEASVALSPERSRTRRGLAGALPAPAEALRRRRRSADFTRPRLDARPAEARGFQRRGEALLHSGKPAEAIRDLDRAIALGDDERGVAHFARGMAQQALGDVEAALLSYGVAIELRARRTWPAASAASSSTTRRSRTGESLPRRRVEAMLHAAAPDSTTLLLSHARLCVRNARREDAFAAYDRLRSSSKPENADAYQERSALPAGKGDTMAARADLARAFELAPDDRDIRAAHGCDRAQAATTPEERAAGLRLIASSADLGAENPEAWAGAAYRFRRAGALDEAVRFMTRALELDPDNVEYLDERATSLRCGAPPVWLDPVGHRASVAAALADAERALALSEDEDGDLELYRPAREPCARRAAISRGPSPTRRR